MATLTRQSASEGHDGHSGYSTVGSSQRPLEDGMARQIVDSEPDALRQPRTAASAPTGRSIPSYQPTRWAVVNRSLDIVDGVTRGRADWAQRLVSYLFVGGFAALVNLSIFSLI